MPENSLIACSCFAKNGTASAVALPFNELDVRIDLDNLGRTDDNKDVTSEQIRVTEDAVRTNPRLKIDEFFMSDLHRLLDRGGRESVEQLLLLFRKIRTSNTLAVHLCSEPRTHSDAIRTTLLQECLRLCRRYVVL